MTFRGDGRLADDAKRFVPPLNRTITILPALGENSLVCAA